MSATQTTIDKFDKRVRAKVDAGMSRREAINQVRAADPQLHERFVAQTNKQDGPIDVTNLRKGERQKIVSAWNRLVQVELQSTNGDKRAALASAARKHPEVHAMYRTALYA